MDGVKNFFGGLANVAEAVAHEIRLNSDDKDDIYHEWFSTLRIRYISQIKMIENKLSSKIVRVALEDTLQDMLQKNYEEANWGVSFSPQSEIEKMKIAIRAVLLEYFTLRVIRLFILTQADNNPNGFNINRSLFFNCLINATETSFDIINDAKEIVHEVVQTCKTLRGKFY